MSGLTSTTTSSSSSSTTPAQRVGEIFTQAAAAFEQLGQLTSQLSAGQQQQQQQQQLSEDGKWTEEELEMLRSCVTRFAEDLSIVSQRIKGRMVGQIRNTLKKKALEEAGLGGNKQASLLVSQQQQQPQQEVTLNALNAGDSSNNEVDVEGMGDAAGGAAVVEEEVVEADADDMEHL